MTDPAATVCRQCKHLFVVNKGDHWARWLCMKAPLPARYNPVTGETVADPPYSFARYTNDGHCEFYESGPNTLNPREMPDG